MTMRKRKLNEAQEAAAAEQRRLAALDKQRKPWQKQREKYQTGAIQEETTPANSDEEAVKKSGCKTCAAKGLKRLILGSAKLLKAELGVDAASPEVYEQRKKICLQCEFYDFGVCQDCGCILSAKCKLAHEQCSRGEW